MERRDKNMRGMGDMPRLMKQSKKCKKKWGKRKKLE